MTRPTPTRRRRGLSMIEVLLALGLLTAAVLAILGMFPALAKTNKNTMQSSTHLYAAQEMMDKLMAANNKVNSSWTIDYPFGATYNGYRRYRGLTDANSAGTEYDSRCQQLEVEVGWVEEGRSRTINLYGLVCP